ncbi:MAG TPA: cysteine desulfurase [Streptosporangiaceae bacterium]|nr:cysteine desulfurase [Streptosporangiaceae bacterium]
MSTPTPTGNGNDDRGGHPFDFGRLADWMPDEPDLADLAKLATGILTGFAGNGPDDNLLKPPGSGLPEHEAPAPVPAWQPGGPGGQPTFYFIEDRPSQGPEGTAPAREPARFDVDAVRREFPLLAERVNGHPLAWLDNAATTQKPRSVIDRIARFYSRENSNIHRGAHTLATRATEAFEDARSKVARFLGAPSGEEIIFTRGVTEAINLVAQTWGRTHIGRGDEILVSRLEHHANIVPWQQLAAETGAKLKVIGVDDDGQVMLDSLAAMLSPRVKLVAVAHVSNVLGTIVPVAQIIAAAHQAGAKVLIDGAQAVAHLPVQVRQLDADFYAFSGHKVFAPTGIGVLYVKPELLAGMPPWQGGGNMISDVTFERTSYQPAPAKFEAGTGNIAGAIALGAAIDFVTWQGLARIGAYEHQLLEYATRQLCAVPGLRLIGTAPQKASVLTFVLDGHDPADVGATLDRQGIAVRAGHHCAQPILRRYGLEAAVRPSLAMYNTRAEVDRLVAALHKIAAKPS